MSAVDGFWMDRTPVNDLGDFGNWWRFGLGADWRHPRGPNSTIIAEKYCRRYRPAARMPEPIDMSTSHRGFRCIYRPASSW